MSAQREPTQQRVCLVIAAHPDDVESWAGGAVAGLAQAGWRVVYLLCTSGDKGTSDPTEAPVQVAARREDEQRAACRVIGAAEPAFLRLPDGELEDDRALLRLLTRAIRVHRPALLLTHDAVTPWPPYTCHRDHRVVGRVALDAAYPYARDPLSFPELLRDERLPPHVTPEVWLFCSAAPDHYVDITATLDLKIAARLEHRSQTVTRTRWRATGGDVRWRLARPLALAPPRRSSDSRCENALMLLPYSPQTQYDVCIHGSCISTWFDAVGRGRW